MAEHTPLPWSISYGFDARTVGGKQPPAVYVGGSKPEQTGIKLASPWVEGAWDDDAEAAANAEFIVRACNVHYELLSALKAMVLNDKHTYRDCHKAALAAIAKAEGAQGSHREVRS